MIRRVLEPTATPMPTVTTAWRAAAADRVVAVVEEHRASWQFWHLWAETQCRYAHHVVAMRDGAVHAQGAPEDVVDVALVEAVFDTHVEVVPDPVTGAPLCVPIGRRGRKWATNLRAEGLSCTAR
jgi:hypothetical protein